MITLDTGQTLSAKAGTNNVITCSIFKDLKTTANSYTPTQAPIPSSVGTLYTSTGGQTLITEMQLVNTTAADVNGITFYVIGVGSTNQISAAFTIPANGSASYSQGKFTIYNSSGYPISVVLLSTATPQPLGVAAPGTSSLASRDDHVHVMPRLDQVTAPTAPVSLNSQQVINAADPTSPQALTTKNYVDLALANLNPAESVYATTTANIPGVYLNGTAGVGATFTVTATGVFSSDGVTPPIGSRFLLKDQTAQLQNGVYVLTTLGSVGVSAVFTRAADYNTPADMNVAGSIPVQNGSTWALSSWLQTATITTIGVDAVVFQDLTANPSLYLLKSNNLSDLSNITTARTNLGLGTASTKNVGNSVVDPGTGSLEIAVPTILLVATSKTYVGTDRGKAYQRSNSGSAMTDTLPSLGAGDNGYQLIISNVDTVLAATLTVTTPVGLFPNGTASFVINYGRRQTMTWNGSGWVFVTAGNNNLVKLPTTTIVAGDFPEFVDSTGQITNRTPAQVRSDLSVPLDSAVVHLTGNETIAGIKSFSTVPNAPAPSAGADLTNKTYVDTVAAGVTARHLAQSAWVTNVAITGLPAANDGVTLTAGQIALLTNQTTPSQNGLWAVAAGAWTRPTYFATGSDAVGSYVMVETGTVYAGSEWFLIGASPITVDTTAQSWVEITGLFDVTVDTTLTKTGNQLSRAASTGDVIIPAGSNVATIQPNAVDNTKAAQMVAHTYKGNNTGATANAADLTRVQVTADLVAATIALQGMMSANDKKKLNTAIFDVANDFGGDPTGSADSLTAFNNAIAAAQTNGFLTGSAGLVWLGGGRFRTSGTVNITGDNITVAGFGGGSSLDSGNYYTGMGAAIVPTGAFPAVVVSAVTTNGLAGQPNTGFKWKGVAVDGYAANATIGLQLISCQNFDIDDFYAINCTDCALDFNTLPGAALTIAAAFPLAAATLTVNSTLASGSGSAFATSGSVIVNDGTGTPRLVTYTGKSGTTLTGASSGGLGTGSAPIGGGVRILPIAQDTTRGMVGQINIRALDGGATSGIGIRLNGDGGGLANTNLIHFFGNIKIAHLNGAGIKDINSDTNLFDSVTINRAGGGTGVGAEIGAGSTVSLASRNNVFRHASFGAGALVCRGTPTATFPSGPTRVYDYQLANGEALPVIEAGAILQVNYNGGISPEFNTANSSTGTLTLTGASATLIIGQIKLPPNGLQVGSSFRLRYPYTKTAAGTVARISGVKIGPLGTAADPTVNSVTRTPTAIADSGFEEMTITITALGAAANSVMSSVRGKQLATAVGFDNVAATVNATQGTPVAFSSVTSGFLYLSFFLSSGAASTEVVSVLAPAMPEVLKGGNT